MLSRLLLPCPRDRCNLSYVLALVALGVLFCQHAQAQGQSLLDEVKHEGAWSEHETYSTVQRPANEPEESYYLPKGAWGKRFSYFSDCPYRTQPTAIIDISEALQTQPELKYGCVFNPSIVLLPDREHFLVGYRVFYHKFPWTPCPKPPHRDKEGHPWYTKWSGGGGWGLAVLHIPLSPDGKSLTGPVLTKSNYVVWSKGEQLTPNAIS